MNLIIWNCRGAASKTFPGRIRDLIGKNHIHILAIVETRVSGVGANKVIRKLGFNNWIRLESTGYAGGIWLLWNNFEVDIQYIKSSTQMLHVHVKEINSNNWFWFTCVYAEPNYQKRVRLWEDISDLNDIIQGPWLVAGDFNAYLSDSDKMGGACPNRISMRQFGSCIANTELMEMEYVGERYTWEKNLMKERIDWAFTNLEWNIQYPFAKVHHLSKFGSDHRPLFIRATMTHESQRFKPPFRCQAAWILEDDFVDIVQKGWDKSSWRENIESFTSAASEWNIKRVGNIMYKKNKLLKRIEGVEKARSRRDSQYLLQVEKDLWKEYNKVLAQEELLWYQKSRCNWLRWGDRNSRFFHASTLIKRRRDRIEGLQDEQGEWVYEQNVLKNMARSYYNNLFSSEANTDLRINSEHSFPPLNDFDKNLLSCYVTDVEIKEAVFDMGGFKAPGPDGIQAFFYQEYWHVVGEKFVKW